MCTLLRAVHILMYGAFWQAAASRYFGGGPRHPSYSYARSEADWAWRALRHLWD